MFKRGEISTETGRAQFIFTIICFIASIITAILIFISFPGNYLAIFAAIMMLILAAAALFVLFGLLSDYSYIENETLYMHYMFKSNSIRIKDIGKIILKDDIYHVCDKKGKEVGTINALAIGIDSILNELYSHNTRFK